MFGSTMCAMELTIGERTLIVGIVNATDDSFSGDGLGDDVAAIRRLGERMVEEGADVIEVGAASSRLGHAEVPLEQELRRATTAIGVLADLSVPLSVDSTRPEVVEACLAAGSLIVNDVSGLTDVRLAELAARHGAWLVVMHSEPSARPRDERDARPDAIVGDVAVSLRRARERAVRAGVAPERIVVDPGLGFHKLATESFALLRHLARFREIAPVMVGPSRKGHLGVATGRSIGERVFATAAAVACAVLGGADLIRVHDEIGRAHV